MVWINQVYVSYSLGWLWFGLVMAWVSQVWINQVWVSYSLDQSSPVISLVSGAFHRSSFGPHSISFGLLSVSFGPLAVYFGLYAVSLDVVDFSSDFFRLFLVNSLAPRVVSSA